MAAAREALRVNASARESNKCPMAAAAQYNNMKLTVAPIISTIGMLSHGVRPGDNRAFSSALRRHQLARMATGNVALGGVACAEWRKPGRAQMA